MPTEVRATVCNNTMKAIVQDKYGSHDVLNLVVIDRPLIIADDEVLVRVHAAGVNWADWAIARGVPYLFRMMFGGLRRPKSVIRGTDVAGTVEAVGKGVSLLSPGDKVFGWCEGAFAEYVCAEEDHFALKPSRLTFEQVQPCRWSVALRSRL